VVTVAMVVAMIFCIVLLLSIVVAYLYGAFFLNPPNPDTALGKVQLNATPWYLHSFTLSVAAVGAVLAGLITLRARKKA
jgi:Mn2+/Fe2+ NRAMP family transporter